MSNSKRYKHSKKIPRLITREISNTGSKFNFLLHPIALVIGLSIIVASAIFMTQEVSGQPQKNANSKQSVPIVWLKVKFKNSQPASSFRVFKQGSNTPIVVTPVMSQEGNTFFALRTGYKTRHDKYIIETVFADKTSQQSNPFEINGYMPGEYGAGIESVEFSGSL